MTLLLLGFEIISPNSPPPFSLIPSVSRYKTSPELKNPLNNFSGLGELLVAMQGFEPRTLRI